MERIRAKIKQKYFEANERERKFRSHSNQVLF